VYYYTCPSQATLYYDVQGILNHYEGILSEIPKNREWVWILDSKGFGLEHAMQTTVATELAKLIVGKFSQNLKKIIIINPTFFVTVTHKIVMPFLSDKVQRIVEINHESTRAEELFL
jgi:aspartate aminotransferase-like enzyme